MGCSISREFFLLVDPADYGLAFDAFPTEFTEEPFNVQFNNLTPDPDNYDYAWYFGNGDSSTVAQPNYTYTANGLYSVTLMATSKLTGCMDTIFMEDMITCTGASGIFDSGLPKVKYWISQDAENLVFDFEETPGVTQIRLFDVYGRQHFSGVAASEKYEIPLIGLSYGVYIFTLEKDGSFYSGKIVLSK
jgi:hypothetical protein